MFWAVLVKNWYVVKYPFPMILVRDDIHIQWPSSYDKACEFVSLLVTLCRLTLVSVLACINEKCP